MTDPGEDVDLMGLDVNSEASTEHRDISKCFMMEMLLNNCKPITGDMEANAIRGDEGARGSSGTLQKEDPVTVGKCKEEAGPHVGSASGSPPGAVETGEWEMSTYRTQARHLTKSKPYRTAHRRRSVRRNSRHKVDNGDYTDGCSWYIMGIMMGPVSMMVATTTTPLVYVAVNILHKFMCPVEDINVLGEEQRPINGNRKVSWAEHST